MKVLLIAEKLDKHDETASYFHGRLLDFADECEALSVLVLENKSHSLPEKVGVHSLGKERGVSKLKLLCNFYRFIIREYANYDHVFVYRSPLYVVLGGLYWRLTGKEVTLWYSHTYEDWMLHLAVILANQVISPSVQSFPFKTSKLKVLEGHDLEAYVCHLKTS